MRKLPDEALRLMTLQAEFPLVAPKHLWMVGSVWIVTRRAVFGPWMLVIQIRPDLTSLMAVEAKLGLRLLKTQCSDETMRLVTGCALARHDRPVGYQGPRPDLGVTFPTAASALEPRAFAQLGFHSNACQ